MARRRRFGDSSLFRQFAKSAYYFTPLPGTGYIPPPLLERDGCAYRETVSAGGSKSYWDSGKGKGSLE